MTRVILVLVITCGTAALLRAEQWPNWRGPSSNGVSRETNLPVRWSNTENIAWRLTLPALSASTAIIWGDRIFLNVARLPSSTYSGSPVLGDGKIYVTNEDGVTVVVKAGPAFELLAEDDVGEYTLSSPAISEGQIFIRTDKAMYAVGKRTQDR